MKRVIATEELTDDTIYRFIDQSTATDRNGWPRSCRPVKFEGTLAEQIERLQEKYDIWRHYYLKHYGKEMRFDNIKTMDNVLTRFRQIDKACKAYDKDFFCKRHKFSYEIVS